MANTSLDGVDHTFEYTRKGEDHVCNVRVTLPDGCIQTFEATCATKHAARLIAVFKASFAVKCAREHSDAAMRQEQYAPAPSEEGVETSGQSSPKSYDVDSREPDIQNEASDMLLNNPVAGYSSSDDDDLAVVRKRRDIPSAPIAFIPAPDTARKPSFVDLEESNTQQNGLVERSSVERSSLGDVELQHDKDVLDAAPSQERSRETSELEEGEQVEPNTEVPGEQKDYRSILASRKRKYQLLRPKLPSPRESSPEAHVVSTPPRRRVKRFRTEPLPLAKQQGKRRHEHQGHQSGKTSKPIRPIRPSRNRRLLPEELDGNESPQKPRVRRRHDKTATRKRKPDSPKLPVRRNYIDRHERIPRRNEEDRKLDDVDLDMTKTEDYAYTPYYPQQAPLESVPQETNPGQIPTSTPAFAAHPMFSGTGGHPMSFPSQYVAPNLPHEAPHMGAPYSHPTPFGTTTPNPMIVPSYMHPGFPPQMMPHSMGGYPYHQTLPNGSHPFYQPPTPTAYHPSQLQGDQKVQREAQIRAAAAQKTAELAAKAAEEDAVRNAKSDFEAHQREQRARHMSGIAMRQAKPNRKTSGPQPEKRADARAPVAIEPASQQRQESGDKTKLIDSIPVEECDQEDYVSALHKMAQKGQICANLSSPSFVTVRSKNDPRCGQQCTMSVRFVLDPDNEEGMITKTAVATKKRIAKQLAAKALLAEIEGRMKSLPQSSEEETGQKEKATKASLQKKVSGFTTAVAALYRLYTLNALYGPPVFKPEEPAGGVNKGTWRSVVLLDVKDFGKRSFEEFGISKKNAKQKCALKAFEALKEMKVPGTDSFANVTTDGRDLENENTPVENGTVEDAVCKQVETAKNAAPIEAIVDVSDEDGESNSSVDAELAPSDDRLLLPKGYRLVFPETEADCSSWLKENSQADAQFGLFVDSPRARVVFASARPKATKEASKEQEMLQPRFLCLSTAMSGIVISFPEVDTGMMDTQPDDDGHASLPEVVVDVLEDPMTKKSGFALEDGISVLELEEDFRSQSVNDISVVSLAITGVETVKRRGPLATLPELIKHWLRKETGKISVKGAWTEQGDIPEELKTEHGKDITTGVLAAYASFCISQQMKPAARQKRTRTHGVAVAFLQLSEQLMSPAPA